MTSDHTLQRFSFKALGSVCEVQLYLPKKRTNSLLPELKKSCQNFVDGYEKKYSRYQDGSLTSQINRSAGCGKTVKIDEETSALFAYADTLFEQSQGLFDITSGVLRRVWNFKNPKIPSEDEISTVLPLINWKSVEWTETSVYLPRTGMEIDFGGYVKEYIADKLAMFLEEKGLQHGLVNLGGDIKIFGPHPDGSPWQVGIQHPRQRNKAIAKLPITRGGVASSGDYERFMIVDGTRYCHLLDPRSGKSITPTFCSISVVAPECLIAGSLTTIALLKSESSEKWLEDIGVSYLCIDQHMNYSGNLITPPQKAET